jgi:hypothetical protein
MRHSFRLGSSIRILVGAGVAAVALGLNAPLASAQDTNPAAATAQLPTSAAKPAKSSYKPYFVEFRARAAASYGHMYVLYGQVNGNNEIIKSDIAGLHPAGDANNCDNCSVFGWTIGHVIFVPSETGASDGDLEEKYVSSRYRVMVDAATFQRVSAYIAKLKAENPLWNALWRNCVSFGNDIAGNLGLKTPGTVWIEPKDYVDHLRFLNGGKPQTALRYAAPGSAKTSSAATHSAKTASVATASVTSASAKTVAAAPVSSATPIPPAKPTMGKTSAPAAVPQKPKKQTVASAAAAAPAAVPAPAPPLAYGTPQ